MTTGTTKVPSRPTAVLVGLALIVAACGGSATPAPTASPASSPAPTASVEPTPPPTATPSHVSSPSPVQSEPVVFESVVYPYRLTMPAGVLTRQWRAATRAWDGQSPYSRTSPIVDANGTADGSLLVWGLPWDGDAATFAALVEEIGGRYNACTLASDLSPMEVDGVPGMTFQHACLDNTLGLSAVLVKDGYGISFRVVGPAAHEPAVLERLTGWMAGATWPLSP